MRRLVFFLVLFFSSDLFAQKELFGYLAGMQDNNKDNNILELGFIEEINSNSFFGGSIMSYEYNDYYSNGINFSINASVGRKIKTYIGIGGFITDYEGCGENKKNQYCLNDMSGGVYPELGLQLTLNNVKFGVFSRIYLTNNDKIQVFGMFIGHKVLSQSNRY